MSTTRLSHTSYLVLGLVAGLGTATPYELKQMVNTSLGYFWPFPHSQLYSEPDRLAELGLLQVEQEASGRRRKRYSITEAGREALTAWLKDPDGERTEMREPGLLKLFFGALASPGDVTRLAQTRVRHYEQDLERYTEIEKSIKDHPELAYPHATLRLGISVARACLAFWSELADEDERELPSTAGSAWSITTGRGRSAVVREAAPDQAPGPEPLSPKFPSR